MSGVPSRPPGLQTNVSEEQILEEKYQWENAYLTVKNATVSGALSRPQTPGLKSDVSAN